MQSDVGGEGDKEGAESDVETECCPKPVHKFENPAINIIKSYT
jgi:hypothetical protein